MNAIIASLQLPNEEKMISALSVLSLLIGTSLAYAAQRVPSYNVRLEQSGGGVLFILGLALVGTVLPRFC
ncbi:MAG: hypothetical protein WDN29_01385 [Methylovirgula sp.]